jgi:hypothetical protein
MLYYVFALSRNLVVVCHTEKTPDFEKLISLAVYIKIETPCTKSTYGTHPVMYVNNRFSDSNRKPCWAPPAQTHVYKCHTVPANDVAYIGKKQQHRCGRAGTDCKHPAHTHKAASAAAVHTSRTVPTLILVYIYVAVSWSGITWKKPNSLSGPALYKIYIITFGSVILCTGYCSLNSIGSVSIYIYVAVFWFGITRKKSKSSSGTALYKIYTIIFGLVIFCTGYCSLNSNGSVSLRNLECISNCSPIKKPNPGTNPSFSCDNKPHPSEIISVSKRFCTMSELPTPSEGSSHGKMCCPTYNPTSLHALTIFLVPSIYICCPSLLSYHVSLLASAIMPIQQPLTSLAPPSYECCINVCALSLDAHIFCCRNLYIPPTPIYMLCIYFVSLSVTICNGSCGYRE